MRWFSWLSDVARVLRLPASPFEVVFLLETMLAFLDKEALLAESQSHCEVAAALTGAYAADSTAIGSRIGRRTLEDFLDPHRLWREWLATGRAGRFAFVAERSVGG